MSEQEQTKKSGCSRPVVTFFIIAILIVAAFFIVGLVRTCDSDHEKEAVETQQVEQTLQQEAEAPAEAQPAE